MRRNHPLRDPDSDRRFGDARSIARSMNYRPGSRIKPKARAKNPSTRATVPETHQSLMTGESPEEESSPVPDLNSTPGLDNGIASTAQEDDRVNRTRGSSTSLDRLRPSDGKLQMPKRNIETRTFENSIARREGDVDTKRRSTVRFWHHPFHKSLHRY